MSAKIVDLIVDESGLPETFAKPKLESLLFSAGFDPDEATLEQIRVVLADYLQTLILED